MFSYWIRLRSNAPAPSLFQYFSLPSFSQTTLRHDADVKGFYYLFVVLCIKILAQETKFFDFIFPTLVTH